MLSVTNNASWCIGQLVMKVPGAVKFSLEPIYKQLTLILGSKVMSKGLAQNVTIAIGKLGCVDPNSGSSYLKDFIKPWCVTLRYVKNSSDKQQAFMGMCEIIKTNPQAVLDHFDFLCEAFA